MSLVVRYYLLTDGFVFVVDHKRGSERGVDGQGMVVVRVKVE